LPGVSFSALLMTTDAPLAFGWSLALLAFVRLADRDGGLWAVVGGIAAGLGLLAKYSMLFFLPGAVLALLLLPAWRRRIPAWRLALFAGLTLLLFSPNLLWNLAQGGITASHTLALAAAGGAGPRFGSILAFLGGQLAIAGPLVVAMAAAIWTGIASIGRPNRAGERPLLLLACFVLPFFIVYLPLALATRANANWTGMAYVAATAAAILFAVAPDRRRWIRPILGLQLAMAVIGPALVVAAPSQRLGIAERLVDRVSGWRDLGEALARDLNRRPGARVLFFDATLAKRLIYYARIGRDGFAMWNPEGTAHNELDRVASLEPGAPGPWLVVADRPIAEAALRALFSSVGPTTELGTELPSGGIRRLVLQEVGTFLGYPR
jgi:4-amino-4-deoxy-L-arabinose transferase-like glycosyltransferase